MSPNSDSHNSDRSAEAGANLKIIDLEFETLRQFREVMASRLNYDGFFVVTNDPLPRGTPARFRFLLPDGFVLIEGSAVVAWARHEDESPDEPAGMALLFDQLEQQSREIIDELIDFHIATGGDPFDIGPGASEPGDIATDALGGDSLEAPPSETPSQPAAMQVAESGEASGKPSQEYLPDWLSEVAQKHDVDLSTEATIPVGDTPEAVQTTASPKPADQDFEISLMPEDEEPEHTPLQPDAGRAPEITVTPREPRKPPRDLRLRPVLAVVAVLIGASVIVWWIVNRAPKPARPIPPVIAELVTPGPATEPTSELPTEPAAESAMETAREAPPEPGGKPPAVLEAGPESAHFEKTIGPATRVLLVAATRVGDETVITVRTNGELSKDSVRVSRLEDPARVWVRIQGIETFYRPNDIEVGTPEVERVRIGHHPEESPQSIYVVVDLGNPAAGVREHTIDGDTLRIVIGST